MDAVITRHDLVCDHALIRPVGAELHLLVDRAVGLEVVHELGDVVVAVLDAVQRALARALGVLQIPAAHLRERILAVCEHDLLTAGEAAVAIAVGDYQRAAALDELDQVRVVDLRADDGDAHTVVFLRIDLARLYLGERLAQQRQNQPLRGIHSP